MGRRYGGAWAVRAMTGVGRQRTAPFVGRDGRLAGVMMLRPGAIDAEFDSASISTLLS